MDTHTHPLTTAPTRIEIYICSSCTNDYRSRRGYTCWSSIIIKKEARKEIEKCSIRASHIIRRFSSLPIPSVNSISALFSRRCPVRPWSLAIHITQLNRFQYIIDFDSIQSYSDSQFLWPIRRLCWLRSNVYGTPQATHAHTHLPNIHNNGFRQRNYLLKRKWFRAESLPSTHVMRHRS